MREDAVDEALRLRVVGKIDRVQQPVPVAAHRGDWLGPAEFVEVRPDAARDGQGGLALGLAGADVGRADGVDIDWQPAALEDVRVRSRRADLGLDPVRGAGEQRRVHRVDGHVDVLPPIDRRDGANQRVGAVEVAGVGAPRRRDPHLADVAWPPVQDRQERTEVVGGLRGGLRLHAMASAAGRTTRRRAPGASSTQRIR